jgi:hypothetical protein
MKAAEIEEQFRLLQREVALAGDAVEACQSETRASLDALRLEVETLKRYLLSLHPDGAERFAAVRAQVMREVDPEAC